MPKSKLTRFRESVLECVERIPKGNVATCVQVNGPACAHVPRALRYLVENGYPDTPWHRVVNSDRTLLKIEIGDQAARLCKDKVDCLPNGRVDEKFLVACS